MLVLAITLLVTVFCVYIQVQDFADRKEQYNQQIERKQDMLQRARVFSEFGIPIVIKPNPLSIFAKGYEEKLGNEITISWRNLPEFSRFDFMRKSKDTVGSNEKNPYLNIFTEFDVTRIVIIILSILTVFVAAPAISGERENKTLQLLYTNPVGRVEFFLAKYLGNLITLSIPLVFVFVSAAAMVALQPFIQVEPDFFLRVLLMMIGCLLFISVFTLLALIISTATSSSSRSLTYGLLVWMLLVFVYPNALQYTVEKNMEIPSLSRLEKKKSELYDAFAQAKDKFYQNHPLNKDRSYTIHKGGQFFTTFIGVTQKYVFKHKRKELKALLPELFEMQNKLMRAVDRYRSKLTQRQKLVDQLSLPLPNHLLEQTGTKLANTNRYARDIDIRNQARRFRGQVLDYIRSKDGFGYKFFTQTEPIHMTNDMEDYPDKYFQLSYYRKDYPRLDLQDRPKFTYKEPFQFPVEIFFLIGLNLLLIVLGSHLFSGSKVI